MSKRANIIVNIANWPAKRVDHWNTLLKARAIENQVFMIGVNRTGTDGNGLEYVESSQIIDANGQIVKPKTNVDNMAIYNINVSKVSEHRESFPVKNDRQVEFYKSIL